LWLPYRINILLTSLLRGPTFDNMIYIIEDDMSVRRSFEFFLESAELEYKSFGSAISFLSNGMPTVNDLLVLDINLPEMSGLELLKKFSQEKKQIPVIVVTARDDSESLECCKIYGVKAFLRKPVDGKTLMDMITKNKKT
jgi:two-component system, LuxR family, response regulator FixJ